MTILINVEKTDNQRTRMYTDTDEKHNEGISASRKWAKGLYCT